MKEVKRITTAPQPDYLGRENPSPVHTLDKGSGKNNS